METSESKDDNDDDELFSLRHARVEDEHAFRASADTLLEKLYQAMEPLQRSNPDMFLSRGQEPEMGPFLLIDLGVTGGQYNIQVDCEQQAIIFSSPISGQLLYILSEKTGEWVGELDGHNFEGLLVRDLIRQINGVPNL